jgi:hypothetical protein
MRNMLVAGLMLAIGGCRYRPAVIPVSGDAADLQALAGIWDGEYRGIESGRTGVIRFEMSAAADSAFGDVLLTVPGELGPVMPIDRADLHRLHATSETLLSIRFVRIAGGEVRGVLEPYRAPDCACIVHTSFIGRITADTIRGAFRTELENGPLQHGAWRVLRMRR